MSKRSSFLKMLFGLFLLGNLTLIGLSFYMATWFRPVNAQDKNEQQFAIPKGQSIGTIGSRLTEAGLIKNPWAFRLIVKKDGLANKIQAGSFKLSPSLTLSQIAHTLTTGTQDQWVTIQEGWRAEEIAESLVRQNFTQFDEAEFLELAEGNEGRLFPDTYLIPQQISARQYFSLLTNTFDRKVATLDLKSNQTGLNFDQILILASIVEREGRGVENMRYVAGILLNRLRIEMALQVDASLQYANGYDAIQKTWWREPTAADKETESPYNTYLHPGLPPTPICNPGLEAIKATLNPIASEYYYYLHDSSGIGHYAQTYDEHLANINKYLR